MNTEELIVLIVEDEESVRETLVDFLEDHNFVVYQANNGAEGLDLFHRNKPDVILTDLRMPEMDGLTFLDNIQKTSPDTPVIVVSGTGNISDSVQALRSGAWDYIIKPIYDMTIVLVAIEKVMDKARLIQANHQYQENLEILVKERTEALEKANTRLSDINHRLRQIITSSGELTKCGDVTSLGSTIMDELTQHMDATGGSLFFLEEEGLRLISTNEPEAVPSFLPFPLKKNSVINRVLEDGKPLLINDIELQEDIVGNGRKDYTNGSILTFPLLDENNTPIGVITLHNKNHPPFIDQDREIGAILASFSRETLRTVQKSETIRINAEQQRTILNSLHTGILVVDPETLRIVEVNTEATRLIGISEEKIIGQHCSEYINGNKEIDCLHSQQTSNLDNEESVILTHDHHTIPVLRTVVTIQLSGRDHYLVSFVDISANKQIEAEKEKLEAQLVQSQKMEAIGTLAGGLAHDLNNALNGIVSPVSMLLHRLNNSEPITNERLHTQLERIDHSGSRITDMVSQLMAVSQKRELSLAPVDLSLSVAHVLKLIRGTFDKSIEITVRMDKTPAMTSADPTGIEQILLNLCINASHAMTIMRPKDQKWGGVLEIEVRSINVNKTLGDFPAEIENGLYWLIMVSDTGVGIKEDELTNIFTPFYTTKQKGQGTGLGLSMVFNIVRQHLGVISIESKPGLGSVFMVYLPVLPVSPSQKPTNVDYQSLKGSGNILIVEDEKHVRDVMNEILIDLGYSVLQAENGEQAIKVFETNEVKIDLVLMDLIMPKMSGDEAYHQLKQRHPDVGILMVSGFKQDERIQTLMKDDNIRFLQKPFDIYSLASSVKSALQNH